MLLLSALDLHLANSVGLKLFGHLKQIEHILPVYGSFVVDELLMLFQILLIAVEECVHVVVLEHKTEFHWQKIIANEGHEKDEVVDDVLNSTARHYLHLRLKLTFQILPQYINEDQLEERRTKLSEGRSGSPVHGRKD